MVTRPLVNSWVYKLNSSYFNQEGVMAEQMKKEKPRQETDSNGDGNEIRHDMIAEAAYYRAQKRGFQNGDPIEDWLAAEAEIDEQMAEPAGRPSAIVLELENRWQPGS